MVKLFFFGFWLFGFFGFFFLFRKLSSYWLFSNKTQTIWWLISFLSVFTCWQSICSCNFIVALISNKSKHLRSLFSLTWSSLASTTICTTVWLIFFDCTYSSLLYYFCYLVDLTVFLLHNFCLLCVILSSEVWFCKQNIMMRPGEHVRDEWTSAIVCCLDKCASVNWIM